MRLRRDDAAAVNAERCDARFVVRRRASSVRAHCNCSVQGRINGSTLGGGELK